MVCFPLSLDRCHGQGVINNHTMYSKLPQTIIHFWKDAMVKLLSILILSVLYFSLFMNKSCDKHTLTCRHCICAACYNNYSCTDCFSSYVEKHCTLLKCKFPRIHDRAHTHLYATNHFSWKLVIP